MVTDHRALEGPRCLEVVEIMDMQYYYYIMLLAERVLIIIEKLLSIHEGVNSAMFLRVINIARIIRASHLYMSLCTVINSTHVCTRC